MKDSKFVGYVTIKITDAHFKPDDETPTLNEWAGIENGEEFIAEMYSDGEIWTVANRDYFSEEFGEVHAGDWFSLSSDEVEVID